MTQRLIIEYSESRSETIRTRLDLVLDDPPSSGRTTVQHSRGGLPVPRLEASATLSETENDR